MRATLDLPADACNRRISARESRHTRPLFFRPGLGIEWRFPPDGADDRADGPLASTSQLQSNRNCGSCEQRLYRTSPRPKGTAPEMTVATQDHQHVARDLA